MVLAWRPSLSLTERCSARGHFRAGVSRGHDRIAFPSQGAASVALVTLSILRCFRPVASSYSSRVAAGMFLSSLWQLSPACTDSPLLAGHAASLPWLDFFLFQCRCAFWRDEETLSCSCDSSSAPLCLQCGARLVTRGRFPVSLLFFCSTQRRLWTCCSRAPSFTLAPRRPVPYCMGLRAGIRQATLRVVDTPLFSSVVLNAHSSRWGSQRGGAFSGCLSLRQSMWYEVVHMTGAKLN